MPLIILRLGYRRLVVMCVRAIAEEWSSLLSACASVYVMRLQNPSDARGAMDSTFSRYAPVLQLVAKSAAMQVRVRARDWGREMFNCRCCYCCRCSSLFVAVRRRRLWRRRLWRRRLLWPGCCGCSQVRG